MKALLSDAARHLSRLACILAGCSVAGASAAAPLPSPVADAVDWPTALVDLSFLNASERPAGKRGFVHARGESLVFDDGSVARFWGANITAATLFKTDAAAVKLHAQRLSRLGFNLVRLHHHDSYWTSPNIFGAQTAGTRQLDPAMLEKIDWWVKCLKDEGIYVWIDLHVQRKLTAADGIEDFDEIAKGKGSVELKGFNYVNASIEQAMREFSDAYLGHVNAYTHIALKDEPAVAAVLITNENDLTQHYGNALLPNQKVPRHSERFMAEAKRFANEHDLPEDRVNRAWEYGASKFFLNDLEQRFDARMVAHLRGIGVKVPIATTSLWGWQMASLPALTSGDVIDVHAYETTGFLSRDPATQGHSLHMAATAQIAGMPLTMTEWNMGELSAPDRHALPLVIAATASHQGFDALMHYAYSQTPLQQLPGKASNWHAFNDPSRLAMLPAAALMYRRHDVREATTTYAWTPDAGELFDAPPSAAVSAALRLASEHGRLVTAMPAVAALPWLKPGKLPADALPIRRAPAATGGELKSDTGELDRRWKDGIFTIDTPRTQAVAGQLGARTLALSRTAFALQNTSASAAVQSLDDKPIGESDRLLVSLATDSAPVRPDELPFIAQPVRGDVEISAAPGLVLTAPEGVQMRYAQGRYVIHIDSKEPVHWVQLQRRAVSRQ